MRIGADTALPELRTLEWPWPCLPQFDLERVTRAEFRNVDAVDVAPLLARLRDATCLVLSVRERYCALRRFQVRAQAGLVRADAAADAPDDPATAAEEAEDERPGFRRSAVGGRARRRTARQLHVADTFGRAPLAAALARRTQQVLARRVCAGASLG
jgi:hypothetical protein